MIKFLMITVSLFVVPELVGLLLLYFWKKEENNILLAFCIGYIIEFAVLQLITVPMIYAQAKYTTLLILYTIIILSLCIVSLIIIFKKNNKETIKVSLKRIIEKGKNYSKVIAIICIVLIGIQMYMYVGKYTHLDDDDAYYVGTATTTLQTNSIFKYSPTTGLLKGEQTLTRYRLGAFPIYYAIISSWTKVHPAIVAHILLPVSLLMVVYSIYYLLGYELFEKDENKALMFVMLMCFINIFGNYSIRNTFSFLLFRIWQGKAILCNIIMPFILWMLFKANEEKYSFVTGLIIFLSVIAGVFTTTMGIAFSPIMIGTLAVLYGVHNRSIKDVVKCFVCSIPSIVYGILYILL